MIHNPRLEGAAPRLISFHPSHICKDFRTFPSQRPRALPLVAQGGSFSFYMHAFHLRITASTIRLEPIVLDPVLLIISVLRFSSFDSVIVFAILFCDHGDLEETLFVVDCQFVRFGFVLVQTCVS